MKCTYRVKNKALVLMAYFIVLVVNVILNIAFGWHNNSDSVRALYIFAIFWALLNIEIEKEGYNEK